MSERPLARDTGPLPPSTREPNWAARLDPDDLIDPHWRSARERWSKVFGSCDNCGHPYSLHLTSDDEPDAACTSPNCRCGREDP